MSLENLNLTEFQQEVSQWERYNFGEDQPSWCQIMGMTEELGELAHAYLKRHQGIRGDAEKHTWAMIDAIGDLMIYLAAFCEREKINLEAAVQKTWGEVRQRDWRANPNSGRADEGSVVG